MVLSSKRGRAEAFASVPRPVEGAPRNGLLQSEACALRKLCVQQTRRVFAGGSRGKGATPPRKRCVHIQRLVGRHTGRGAPFEGTSRSFSPLSPHVVHMLIKLARCSAVFAAVCTLQSQRKDPGSMDDVKQVSKSVTRAESDFDQCLSALRAEKGLSSTLVRQLGTLCSHAAHAAAQRQALVRSCPRGRGVWRAEELQRRLNDVRAEIALDAAQTTSMAPQEGWRGVNFGGWLLWEPGPADKAPVVRMVRGTPPDEWTLSERLRERYGDAQAERMMQQHRATLITKRDFVEIRDLGMNAVRIPFSYWLVQGPFPGEAYLGPDLEPLDNAFRWAQETGLSIILCYHGTIGCQSDHQATGRCREDWNPNEWVVDANVEVLRKVAKRYKGSTALGGITVVNEPSCRIPLIKLRRYYRKAYSAIRSAGVPERVEIIFPIYQRPHTDLDSVFREEHGFKNVVFDVHIYHMFTDNWFRMSLANHLRWAAAQGRWHDSKDIADTGARVIVSEWCLALPTFAGSLVGCEWSALTRAEQTAVLRSFARRQVQTFADHTHGWFFWSWKDEEKNWNFREICGKGWLTF